MTLLDRKKKTYQYVISSMSQALSHSSATASTYHGIRVRIQRLLTITKHRSVSLLH